MVGLEDDFNDPFLLGSFFRYLSRGEVLNFRGGNGLLDFFHQQYQHLNHQPFTNVTKPSPRHECRSRYEPREIFFIKKILHVERRTSQGSNPKML